MRYGIIAAILICLTIPANAKGHHHYRHHARIVYADRGEILPHPAGCPRTEFCGCGAAEEIFGRPIRWLWLAANWLGFPRAAPGYHMAAVRQHHVMVIRQYLGDDRAIVYDANSGHHLTRVHEVSLAGYRIVDPNGGSSFARHDSRGHRARASWYVDHHTASGEPYRPNALTFASRDMPFGTMVRFTYRGRSVVARDNDHGPYVRGRRFDFNRGVARALHFHGVQDVSWQVVR